jgi:hypothetical protein
MGRGGPIFIDGLSQGGPGYSGPPLVQISGAGIGGGTGAADGLDIRAGNSTVTGLIISGFRGDGIYLTPNGGDTIQDCYIGTDPTGTLAQGNTGFGIDIRSTSTGQSHLEL